MCRDLWQRCSLPLTAEAARPKADQPSSSTSSGLEPRLSSSSTSRNLPPLAALCSRIWLRARVPASLWASRSRTEEKQRRRGSPLRFGTFEAKVPHGIHYEGVYCVRRVEGVNLNAK